MKKRKFTSWRYVVLWFCLIVIYVIVNALLIVEVGGYRVNWYKLRLEETGLIFLKGNDSKIQVKLNGETKSDHLPVRLPFLLPGHYLVQISKDGYNTWEKNYRVEEDKAFVEEDITLFKKDAVPVKEQDKSTIEKLESTVLPYDIEISNGEVWADGKLVSRFSEDPKYYYWYNNRQYIIYQIDDEIKVIGADGSNDMLLVKLHSNKPSVFKTINLGRELLYKDGDEVYRIKLK